MISKVGIRSIFDSSDFLNHLDKSTVEYTRDYLMNIYNELYRQCHNLEEISRIEFGRMLAHIINVIENPNNYQIYNYYKISAKDFHMKIYHFCDYLLLPEDVLITLAREFYRYTRGGNGMYSLGSTNFYTDTLHIRVRSKLRERNICDGCMCCTTELYPFLHPTQKYPSKDELSQMPLYCEFCHKYF